MNKEGRTTIMLSREVKAELDKLGAKGDTYDVILRRLLKMKQEIKK